MAKKSSSNRQRQASHAKGGANKAQTVRQSSTATLVRAANLDAAGQSSTEPTSSAETQPKPSAASIVRDTPAATTKPVAQPTTRAKATAAPAAKSPTAKSPAPAAKAPAPATKPAPATTGKRQDTRMARAKATQRARQAGRISAENYAYVVGDLKLVAWLAGGAFAILIALAFVLPR